MSGLQNSTQEIEPVNSTLTPIFNNTATPPRWMRRCGNGVVLPPERGVSILHSLLDQVIRLLGSQVCNAIARFSRRGNEGFIFLNYLNESFNYIRII